MKKGDRVVWWEGLRYMPNPDAPRAELIEVQEWPHAFLVIGTSDTNLAARELGSQVPDVGSQMAALQLARRPLHHDEHGSCVAFYFNVAGERVSTKERNRVLRNARSRT